MPAPMRSHLTVVVIVCMIGSATCKDYDLFATGQYKGSAPQNMGVGFNFANENSNPFIWLKYLNSNLARIFIQPMIVSDGKDPNGDRSRWRSYASNSWNLTRSESIGDQFGVSFSGTPVSSQEDWSSAVGDLRSSPGSSPFFEWLTGNTDIPWRNFLKPLNTSGIGVTMAQLGNAQNAIDRLKDLNSDIIAVWDVRCKNLPYTTMDRSNPEYWKERWETYRLMYIGGQWMARNGVGRVELYNEPDKDFACLEQDMWVDMMRIHSQAFQDAYADYSSSTGTDIRPDILGPSTSVGWSEGYSSSLIKYFKTPFPANTPDDNWNLISTYAFHKYGSFSKKACETYGAGCKSETGFGLRSTYDNAVKMVSVDNNNVPIPAVITEFNCFTASQSESVDHPYFVGKHIMDLPATAACITGQVAGLVSKPNGPNAISLHKMVQNLVAGNPSKIGKNGLFYAHVTASPFIITSSTKAAEAYRLILRRAIGKQVLEFKSNEQTKSFGSPSSRVTLWGVDDDKAYYLYLTNEEFDDNDVTVDLSSLNVAPGTHFTVNAVADYPELSSSYHGEVSDTQPLADDKTIHITSLSGSFISFTIPKGPSERLVLEATDDATVTSGVTEPAGSSPTLKISSSEELSIVLLKFDVGDKRQSLSNAILQLHLESSNNEVPQVVMVLGIREPWAESDITWDKLATLRQSLSSPITAAADNPIYWKGPDGPNVAGHVTIPPGSSIPPNGLDLRLDVTDTIRDGVSNFLLVRMFRYDQSEGEKPSRLPADNVQGIYVFSSRESDNPDAHPKLLIDVPVTEQQQQSFLKPGRESRMPAPAPAPIPLTNAPIIFPPTISESLLASLAPSPLSFVTTLPTMMNPNQDGENSKVDDPVDTNPDSHLNAYPPWGGVNLAGPIPKSPLTESQGGTKVLDFETSEDIGSKSTDTKAPRRLFAP